MLLLVLGCAVQVGLGQVGGEGCSWVCFVGMMPASVMEEEATSAQRDRRSKGSCGDVQNLR